MLNTHKLLKRINDRSMVQAAYKLFLNPDVELIKTINDGQAVELVFFDNKNHWYRNLRFEYKQSSV